MVTPLISPPHQGEGELEAELWAMLKGRDDPLAREALFTLHGPYARGIARRHFRERGRGDIERADFEQWAFEALLEAIERYEPERGVPFRAYAIRRISGNIINGVRHMTEVREQLSWQHRMRQDRIRSLSPAGEDLSLEQAMAALGELAVGLALGFMLEGTGLFVDEEGNTAPAASTAFAYDSVAWKDLTARLDRELAELNERERTILQLHYIQGVGFDHLAALLKVSKGRVSQLHRGALTKLRKRMTAKGQFRLEQ